MSKELDKCRAFYEAYEALCRTYSLRVSTDIVGDAIVRDEDFNTLYYPETDSSKSPRER